MRKSRQIGSGRASARVWALLAPLALLVPIVLAAPALAHLERPSYWPDPAPDTSVKPAAGGEVPTARSFASAVTGKGPGEVRVVCKGAGGELSLRALKRSLRSAVKTGFRLRPSQPVIKYSEKKASKLLKRNKALAKECDYREIQPAIDDSGNNDRVVIMPGRYTEPTSRSQPTNDPRCNPSLLQADQTGALTPSYEYHATCPNDQNLIYLQGRAVKGDPLPVPDPDRHGIPEQELGKCVRCNMQIEGSGVKPEDVLLDAGKGYENPRDPLDQPAEFTKHVVIRTDRSDGFVGRNFLLRGAREHGFYTEETDGILLDRVKFFWNADYGHLSFTTDHNVIKNCEGLGSGDAAVYPGSAPQTGEFRDETFYPVERLNTVIKKCDLHGNILGYSGSMGNSVQVTRNHFYGNTTGLASDTLSAPRHPGYPADGMKIDHNYFYSNNLNLYKPDPVFEPYVNPPVGTGIALVGYNDVDVSNNWFFDNWRHAVLLNAIPDAIAGEPEGNVDSQIHCEVALIAATSCDNRLYANNMGRVPPDFNFPPADVMGMFGNLGGNGGDGGAGGYALPNGVDFWWDEFPGNTGNCWYENTGSDGTAASVTGSGSGAPPDILPSDCGASVGLGDVIKEAVLLDCAMWSRGQTAEDLPLCYFLATPPQPGTMAARRWQREWDAEAAKYAASPAGRALDERLDEIRAAALSP